jgi:hypothetical protein
MTEPVVISDLPPFPPLTGEMDACLMVNERKMIWLVHDRPFRDYLHWVEFDADRNKLTLVLGGGRVQDYGREIHRNMADLLKDARQIFTLHVENKKVVDTYVLPLVVRDIRKQKMANSG